MTDLSICGGVQQRLWDIPSAPKMRGLEPAEGELSGTPGDVDSLSAVGTHQ
jgi:hypothetical protein